MLACLLVAQVIQTPCQPVRRVGEACALPHVGTLALEQRSCDPHLCRRHLTSLITPVLWVWRVAEQVTGQRRLVALYGWGVVVAAHGEGLMFHLTGCMHIGSDLPPPAF